MTDTKRLTPEAQAALDAARGKRPGARLPQQVVKVKNYGDEYINRLAVTLKVFGEMEAWERTAVLNFIKSKYREDWPLDP